MMSYLLPAREMSIDEAHRRETRYTRDRRSSNLLHSRIMDVHEVYRREIRNSNIWRLLHGRETSVEGIYAREADVNAIHAKEIHLDTRETYVNGIYRGETYGDWMDTGETYGDWIHARATYVKGERHVGRQKRRNSVSETPLCIGAPGVLCTRIHATS